MPEITLTVDPDTMRRMNRMASRLDLSLPASLSIAFSAAEAILDMHMAGGLILLRDKDGGEERSLDLTAAIARAKQPAEPEPEAG